MKTLKKTLTMLLALAATLTFAACGGEEAPVQSTPTAPVADGWQDAYVPGDDEAVTDDNEAVTDNDVPVQTQPTEPVGQKYESQKLIPYGAAAQAKNAFKAFADDAQKMFYAADGTLMHIDDLSTDFWFGGRDVQSTTVVYGTPAYNDAKGYTYIRLGSKEYPTKDIRGEIFWAFEALMSGDLVLCSREEDGSLYINSLDATGVKTRDNQQLYLYDYRNKTYLDHADFIRFVRDDRVQPNIYAEVDGVVYYSNVTGISYFDDKPQIWVDSLQTWNADDVLTYGYGGAETPLYKKADEHTAIYYGYGFDLTELPIFLPQGKTVEQLTNVVFGDTTYLFFDDGSVYAGELVHTVVGPDFFLDETLTQLNRAGAILEVYQSTFVKGADCRLRLLLDDNVTYEYFPEVM